VEVVDIYDVHGHLKLLDGVRAVYTQGCDADLTVSVCSFNLGQPHADPSAVNCCRHKHLMRERLNRHEEFRVCSTFASLHDGKYVFWGGDLPGGSMVVKPSDNCGGRGVSLASPDTLGDALDYAMSNSRCGTVVVEEYFTGTEHTVEVVFDQDGACHPINVCDRFFLPNGGGFFVETGHANPSLLDTTTKKDLYSFVERAARAIGISWGVFKCDVILTPRPVILECTARLSGGFDAQYTQPLAYGTNPILATMKLSLGEDLDDGLLTPALSRHAVCLSPFPTPGVVKSITLSQTPSDYTYVRARVGDAISYRSGADRPAYCVASGGTRREAMRRARSGFPCIETV